MMAILYVRSTDGNDADNGSTWALAKATLAGAFTAASAGDTIYVSYNHAETQASQMTLTPPGTAASPCYVICVDDSAEPPTALATTASAETTGSNLLRITTGFALFYGITFRGSTSGTQGCVAIGAGQTLPLGFVFINCQIAVGAGNTSSACFTLGSAASSADDNFVTFINTTLYFTHVNHNLSHTGGRFTWLNTPSAVLGTAVPTFLYQAPHSVGSGTARIHGVDLSALGSSKSLIKIDRGSASEVYLRNCKLGSSVSLTTGSIVGSGGVITEFVNCDSTDTNYRYWYQDYAGTIEHETTIVRSGGASDGTTPISRELISSANSNKFYPLVLKDISIWNETTGSSKTLTVHLVTDNVTLTNQECWLEVEYLGTSGYPLSSFADDADSITDRLLAGSASNLTSSSETWTTTGLTTPVKQQVSVSVTPQEKGPIRCRLVLVKPSTTVYVCPKVVIS